MFPSPFHNFPWPQLTLRFHRLPVGRPLRRIPLVLTTHSVFVAFFAHRTMSDSRRCRDFCGRWGCEFFNHFWISPRRLGLLFRYRPDLFPSLLVLLVIFQASRNRRWRPTRLTTGTPCYLWASSSLNLLSSGTVWPDGQASLLQTWLWIWVYRPRFIRSNKVRRFWRWVVLSHLRCRGRFFDIDVAFPTPLPVWRLSPMPSFHQWTGHTLRVAPAAWSTKYPPVQGVRFYLPFLCIPPSSWSLRRNQTAFEAGPRHILFWLRRPSLSALSALF